MRDCRKCNNRYNEKYSFCPKCGTPFDVNAKKTKVPNVTISNPPSVSKIIIDTILYMIGGLIALANIFAKGDLISRFIMILFGLSLFSISYKLISNKFSNPEIDTVLKVLRVVIPIGLIFVSFFYDVFIYDSPTTSTTSTTETVTQNEQQSQNMNKQKEENTVGKQKSIEEHQKKEEVIYELTYNKAGKYGKQKEYEGSNEYFYYFPDGKYSIELIRQSGVACFLWIDYNNGYNTEFGTAYNNKEKLTFTTVGQSNFATLTSNLHIYNSNDCDYKLTKIN